MDRGDRGASRAHLLLNQHETGATDGRVWLIHIIIRRTQIHDGRLLWQ
jgi:hypothetical protein